MRLFGLILLLAFSSNAFSSDLENRFGYSPERNGPVYEVVGRRCTEGILNENASPIGIGSALARDAFYRDSKEVNNLLDAGGWNVIELPYQFKGDTGTVCDNNGKPTKYILTVRRIEWPRKSGG